MRYSINIYIYIKSTMLHGYKILELSGFMICPVIMIKSVSWSTTQNKNGCWTNTSIGLYKRASAVFPVQIQIELKTYILKMGFDQINKLLYNF